MFDPKEYRKRAEAAFKDLRAFVEKHKCIVSFESDDNSVWLYFPSNNSKDKITLQSIDNRWGWTLVDCEDGSVLLHEMSPVLEKEDEEIEAAQEKMLNLDHDEQERIFNFDHNDLEEMGEEVAKLKGEMLQYIPLECFSDKTQQDEKVIDIPLAKNFKEIVKKKAVKQTTKHKK